MGQSFASVSLEDVDWVGRVAPGGRRDVATAVQERGPSDRHRPGGHRRRSLPFFQPIRHQQEGDPVERSATVPSAHGGRQQEAVLPSVAPHNRVHTPHPGFGAQATVKILRDIIYVI